MALKRGEVRRFSLKVLKGFSEDKEDFTFSHFYEDLEDMIGSKINQSSAESVFYKLKAEGLITKTRMTEKAHTGKYHRVYRSDYGFGKNISKAPKAGPVKKATSKAGPVKSVNPNAIRVTDQISNLEVTYEDLGLAVALLLGYQTKEIDSLRQSLTDEQQACAATNKEWKKTVDEKNKTIEELKEQVETLRNKAGTFKMGEVAKIKL